MKGCAFCYEPIPAGDFVVDHEGFEWPMHKQCAVEAGCPDGFVSVPADCYGERHALAQMGELAPELGQELSVGRTNQQGRGMTMEIEFVDELPQPEYRGKGVSTFTRDFADGLRKNPGAWGVWPKKMKLATLRGYASKINAGLFTALPKDEFRAAVRQGVLYVRYVGSGE